MHARSVISINDLNDDDIRRLFFRARALVADRAEWETTKHRAVLMTAFFEPSTRTRLSFEMAALRLGLGIATFQASTSSMVKGESVFETIHNLMALGPDILVIRQPEIVSASTVFGRKTAIINAGDGTGEHPTQALLDCFTLLEHFRCDDLRGKRIMLVGDLAHSRVAHSNVLLMKRLGAEITLLAPALFHEVGLAGQNLITSFDQCQGPYDAVMCLRIQKERMSNDYGMTDADYFRRYGVDAARLEQLGDSCVVLHPGPYNRGVEIDELVASSPRSLITEQVRNGVAVRAALIEHCLLEGVSCKSVVA